MSSIQESRTLTQQAIGRLSAMCQPNQQTWDLSPNDVDAIRRVLGILNALADYVAVYEGKTIPQAINEAGQRVDNGESMEETT